MLSKAALIAVTDYLIKEIIKLIYRIIWKGNDKIKRTALVNDTEEGGLIKMLDIQSMILAQWVMLLKRFVDEENSSSWKTIFDYFLSPVGGKFILKCNFNVRKLPVYLPAFYKNCLNAWSSLNVSPVHTYRDVVHQVIWNNKNITVQQLSVFEKHCFSEGIVMVGDLLSDGGVFLKGANVLNANLSPLKRFKLMGIVDALPCEWKRIIRQSAQHPPPPLPSHIRDAFYLKMEDSGVALSKVSSKLLYVAFKSRKQVPLTAQKKFQEKFPQLQTDWSRGKYTNYLLQLQL